MFGIFLIQFTLTFDNCPQMHRLAIFEARFVYMPRSSWHKS